MKRLDIHLTSKDYNEMAYWVSEVILMYLSVQADYERKTAEDNASE